MNVSAPCPDGFSDRLSALRRARGLTQRQLAQRIGYGVSTVAQWETDWRSPTARALAALAEALEVDMHTLWTGETP